MPSFMQAGGKLEAELAAERQALAAARADAQEAHADAAQKKQVLFGPFDWLAVFVRCFLPRPDVPALCRAPLAEAAAAGLALMQSL